MSSHSWRYLNATQSKCNRCGKVNPGGVHSQPYAGCVKSGNESDDYVSPIIAATAMGLFSDNSPSPSSDYSGGGGDFGGGGASSDF